MSETEFVYFQTAAILALGPILKWLLAGTLAMAFFAAIAEVWLGFLRFLNSIK